MKKALFFLTLLSFSTISFATHEGAIKDTQEASEVAIGDFTKDNTHMTLDKFVGFKSWIAEGGVKVKIYLNDNSSENYSCHRHEAGDPFECHQGH